MQAIGVALDKLENWPLLKSSTNFFDQLLEFNLKKKIC